MSDDTDRRTDGNVGTGADEVRAYDADVDDTRTGDADATSAGSSRAADLNNKSPNEIRDEIEETREKLSEDLDELSYRLSPERAKEEVQERLEDVQEVVAQGVRDLADTAITRAGKALHRFEGRGQTVVDGVEDRPIASSLVAASVVGAGVGWVLWRQVFGGERPRRESYPERSYEERGVRRTTYRPPVTSSRVASFQADASSADQTPTGEAQTPYWSPQTDEAAGRARREEAAGGLQTFVKDNAVALGIGASVAGVAAAFFALRDRGGSSRQRALPPPGGSSAGRAGSYGRASRARTPRTYQATRTEEAGSHKTDAGTRTYSAAADEKYFEEHFRTHYASGDFSDYRAAYLFGTSLAEDERYLDLPWDRLEEEAKRRWEEAFIDPWETRKEAVRYGYDRGKMDVDA